MTKSSSPIHLSSENETRQLGASLAHFLKEGDVVALFGDLGMGKTTLVRGLLQVLLGEGVETPSPTFTLVQMYEADDFPIWHFDLYRLEHPEEVLELDWDDAADGVSLIEWPEKAGEHLPIQRLDVMLTPASDGRFARLSAHGEYWEKKLDAVIQSIEYG